VTSKDSTNTFGGGHVRFQLREKSGVISRGGAKQGKKTLSNSTTSKRLLRRKSKKNIKVGASLLHNNAVKIKEGETAEKK